MPPKAHEQGARLQQHRSDWGGSLFRIFSTAPALRSNAVIPEPLVPGSSVTETSQGALPELEIAEPVPESGPAVHTDVKSSNAGQVMHEEDGNPETLFIYTPALCLLDLAQLCL